MKRRVHVGCALCYCTSTPQLYGWLLAGRSVLSFSSLKLDDERGGGGKDDITYYVWLIEHKIFFPVVDPRSVGSMVER
jgi:hypothetical protein